MATTLLADVNIEGQVAHLRSRMQSEYWRDLWDFLDLQCVVFADVGLEREDPDSIVWRRCQEKQLVLLTNSRNDDGPDSLEATIRALNTPTSIPVFPLSDANEIFRSKQYTEEVVESLYDYLLRLETVLGSGSQYLP